MGNGSRELLHEIERVARNGFEELVRVTPDPQLQTGKCARCEAGRDQPSQPGVVGRVHHEDDVLRIAELHEVLDVLEVPEVARVGTAQLRVTTERELVFMDSKITAAGWSAGGRNGFAFGILSVFAY